MMSHQCQWCSAEVHDGTNLCERCVGTLEVAIGNVAAYHADLPNVRQKQVRYGGNASKGSIGKSQPLPIDGRFADKAGDGSEVEYATRNTVSTWVRIGLDTWPVTQGPTCPTCLHVTCHDIRRSLPPADTVASCCAYLLRNLGRVAPQEWASEMLDEMLDLERRLRRLVDRPAERWYAGKCGVTDEDDQDCVAELYATAKSGTLVCPVCGITHDVGERREVLLTEAREILVTATEAAGALMAWTDYDGSEKKLVDRIRKWRDRDRLVTHGSVNQCGKDRDLYRLGDIEEMLLREARHDQDRRIGAA